MVDVRSALAERPVRESFDSLLRFAEEYPESCCRLDIPQDVSFCCCFLARHSLAVRPGFPARDDRPSGFFNTRYSRLIIKPPVSPRSAAIPRKM